MDKWLNEVRGLEMISRITKGDLRQEARIYSKERRGDGPRSAPDVLAKEKARLTLLYSIRAHARGRLHMTKRKWVVRAKDAEGNTQETVETQPWTLEDQVNLIEGHAKEFCKAA